MPTPTERGILMTEEPTQEQHQQGKRKTKTIVAAIVAAFVIVAVAAAAAMAMSSSHANKVVRATTYQRQLGTALQPLVASNQQLSAAMNAADGSQSTNNAIKVNLKTARTALTSTQGAVGAIVVPTGGKTLSQQTSQALTQENGYLQVVGATLNDPTSASAAQVQPQAANLTTALIPLETVAPGAQKSVYGVDSFYSWSQGAAKKAKAAEAAKNQPPVVNNYNSYNSGTTQTTTTDNGYSSDSTPGLYSVDSNISATTGISSGLAANVFYDYWANGGSGDESYSSWSPSTQQHYDVSASSDGYTVTAYVYGTSIAGSPYVTFSQKAISDYTQADADRFLASGNHG